MRFEARELKPYATFVNRSDLQIGEVYFKAMFADDGMFVPELMPLVFIGTNLEPTDTSTVYFQDYDSYIAGVRYGAYGEDPNSIDEQLHAQFHRTEDTDNFVSRYEDALDMLLVCSLKRQAAGL